MGERGDNDRERQITARQTFQRFWGMIPDIGFTRQQIAEMQTWTTGTERASWDSPHI